MAEHELRDIISVGYAHLFTLDKEVGKARGERLSSPAITRGFQLLHEWYVDQLRPLLREGEFDQSRMSLLDEDFNRVRTCSSGRARITAGTELLTKVRTSLRTTLELFPLTANHSASPVEKSLIAALKAILPSAGSGYEQALRDLASEDRISYRGVAAELREVLREVLDHFAPEDRLPTGTDGRKATMKAKVRFILRERAMGETRRGVAESTVEILDDGVPNLARSAYDLGSLDTHVSPSREDVIRLRRYLEALLLDLLEVAR
jgi:hypothetical protein